MTNSHLAHNVRLGSRVIVASGALLAGYVEVGDLAFISGNSTVHQFVRIGRLAMLSGLSGIGKDVPPFCTTQGFTANRIGGLNVVGMRRAGMAPAQRAEVKRAFRLLYRSGLNVTQALEAIRGELRTGPALEVCDFIEASARGICRMGEAEDQEPDLG
jgi:UDP-N-acetylglucosamine acyltransferase